MNHQALYPILLQFSRDSKLLHIDLSLQHCITACLEQVDQIAYFQKLLFTLNDAFQNDSLQALKLLRNMLSLLDVPAYLRDNFSSSAFQGIFKDWEREISAEEMLEFMVIVELLLHILNFKDIQDLLENTSLPAELYNHRTHSQHLETYMIDKRKLLILTKIASLYLENGEGIDEESIIDLLGRVGYYLGLGTHEESISASDRTQLLLFLSHILQKRQNFSAESLRNVGKIISSLMKERIWEGFTRSATDKLLDVLLLIKEISSPEYNKCMIKFMVHSAQTLNLSQYKSICKLLKLFKNTDFEITEEEWIHLAAKLTDSLLRRIMEEDDLLIKGLKCLKQFVLKIEGNIITSELLFSLGIVQFLAQCMENPNGFVVIEACELLASVAADSNDNFTLQRTFGETKLIYEMYEFFTIDVNYEETPLLRFSEALLNLFKVQNTAEPSYQYAYLKRAEREHHYFKKKIVDEFYSKKLRGKVMEVLRVIDPRYFQNDSEDEEEAGAEDSEERLGSQDTRVTL